MTSAVAPRCVSYVMSATVLWCDLNLLASSFVLHGLREEDHGSDIGGEKTLWLCALWLYEARVLRRSVPDDVETDRTCGLVADSLSGRCGVVDLPCLSWSLPLFLR